MAQFFWQPNAGDLGAQPSDMTYFGISGATRTFNVVDTGGGVLACHISGGTNSAGSGLHWTDAEGPGAFADGELYLRIRKNSTTADWFHSLMRQTANPVGTSQIWTRVVHYISYLSSTAVAARAHNGSSTPASLGSLDNFGTTIPLDLHLVLRLAGDQASFKVWKDGETEPAFTTFTIVGPLGAGCVGFWGGSVSDIYIYGMGVSTGVEDAPRTAGSPPAGTVTASGGAIASGTATLEASSPYGTITIGSALYPVRSAGGSPMNESGVRISVVNSLTLQQAYYGAGHTIVDGVMTISEDGIVAGTAYHVTTKIAADWIGVSDEVTAT